MFRIHGGAAPKTPAKCPRHPLVVLSPALPMLGVRTHALSFTRQDVVLPRNVDIFLLHTGRSATSTNACSCSSRSTRGVHTDSRMPEGYGLPAKKSQSRSLSFRSNSRPSKGLHGMVGFPRTTALVPLLLPHPWCHGGHQTAQPSTSPLRRRPVMWRAPYPHLQRHLLPCRLPTNIGRVFGASTPWQDAHSAPLWNLLIIVWLFFRPLYPINEIFNKFSGLYA